MVGNKSRFSIPFFTGPRLSETIQSLLPLGHDVFSRGEEENKGRKVIAKQYLMERIAKGSSL